MCDSKKERLSDINATDFHYTTSPFLRIALVTPYFRSAELADSGIGNHFYDLAYALTDQGHDVIVVHVDRSSAPTRRTAVGARSFEVVQIGVSTPALLRFFGRRAWIFDQICFELGRILECLKWYRGLPRKARPEVIETTSFGALCLALSFTKSAPPTVVRISTTMGQIMGDYFPLSSRLLRALSSLETLFIRHSRHLITHTAVHRDEVCRTLRLKPERFALIPHGIELPEEHELGSVCSNGKITILYVGRFEYRKGTDVLLAALPSILKAAPEVHVVLVGRDSGDQFSRLFADTHGAEFGARVQRMGPLDRASLREQYRSCDIFVAPSRYESFGLVYVEAMAWGKPVVGCRAGGVPEVIREGVTGLLAKPGDATDLSEKVLQLVQAPDLRVRFGKAARLDSAQRFSRAAMARSSASYYATICRRDATFV